MESSVFTFDRMCVCVCVCVWCSETCAPGGKVFVIL